MIQNNENFVEISQKNSEKNQELKNNAQLIDTLDKNIYNLIKEID